MKQAKTVWHWRWPQDKLGYEIVTPHNRIWGRVSCSTMATKICRTFNFAMNLQEACEVGDMAKINSVLLAYKKES